MVRVNNLPSANSDVLNGAWRTLLWQNTGETKRVDIENLWNLFFPIGIVVPYTGAFAGPPAGFLYCYGQAVSRASYPKLFEVIGSWFGDGDGTTTFNVPDYRCRTLIGEGNVAGVGIHSFGATGGAETHTLTTAQMPAHAHGMGPGGGFFMGINGVGAYGFGAGPNGAVASGLTLTVGSGNAHNNMQPYAAIYWLIRSDF